MALDHINKDLADFLMIEYPRTPVFYLLPKIHKPDRPPKGRLIVSAQGSVLENISKYLDHLLQPHVLKVSTYIRDTGDFIEKIEGRNIPPQALILSLDVSSLYTSIPHIDVPNVVQHHLEMDKG